MKNAGAEREKELKAAQQNLNAAKAKADTFNKKLKQKQQASSSLHAASNSYVTVNPRTDLSPLADVCRSPSPWLWSWRSCAGSRLGTSSRSRL